MIYVMSDIHGCYDKYLEMLKKISFNDDDIMYVLGDIFDRGGKSILVLKDMMERKNIIPLIGNHDNTAYNCIRELKRLSESETLTGTQLAEISSIKYWVRHGGGPSIEELKKYTWKEIEEVLKYIESFSLCEEVMLDNKHFVLVHAGLKNFSPEKKISEYSINDVCFEISNYDKQYYLDGTYIITGHMPTFHIDEASRGKIYYNKNNIAIDCGAAYGETLGCLCLNTMTEYYV